MSALLDLATDRASSLIPIFGLFLDTALKGSLLILAATIVAYLLRGKSAAARHAAWTAAVVGHLTLPFLTLLMPQWRLPIFPAPPWLETPVVAPALQSSSTPSAAGQPVSVGPSELSRPTEAGTPEGTGPIDAGAAPRGGPSGPAAGLRVSDPSFISALGLLWILGTALVLLRLVVGTWRVGRLAKEGDRVDDGEWLSLTQRLAKRMGITRPLILLRGESLAVPITWGVVYPAVLLPPESNEWPETRRRFVLVHEMAHVKRFDALTQLLAQITISLFWFDPLLWYASHRMRVEREHACDDYVLRDGTVPSLYAGELLEMVQSIGSPRHESAAPAFAALAMARRSEFEGRMLAILDARQDRHTLGRRKTLIAFAALALLVLPLAALRPFETVRTATGAANRAIAKIGDAQPTARRIADSACDSLLQTGATSTSNHLHVDADDEKGRAIEYLTTSPGRCAQAAVIGKVLFANDRILVIDSGAYASFREVTEGSDRLVRVTADRGGRLDYAASLDGSRVAFDDSMRGWLSRFIPVVLSEASVDAPQRVARLMARGGVNAVLAAIGEIKSSGARRAHYEALLDGMPLTETEYIRISNHAARTLASEPSDLSAILTRIAASPATGTKSLGAAVEKLARAQQAMGMALDTQLRKSSSGSDSAELLTRYASIDNPEMLLMALRGAKDLSSDTDRRVLLQTIAARALGRKNPVLRKAFFDATAAMTSDTDLRVTLTSALPYGHVDNEVTIAVFKSVASQMTSDSDKRVTLSVAIEQKLLTNAAVRQAFTVAARSIQSGTDFTALMQSTLKQ